MSTYILGDTKMLPKLNLIGIFTLFTVKLKLINLLCLLNGGSMTELRQALQCCYKKIRA